MTKVRGGSLFARGKTQEKLWTVDQLQF